MSRYRFALRPKWILSHLFVLALVGAMIFACLWQLDRLDQRKARNARVAARTALEVEPVTALASTGSTAAEIDALEFRRVTATGTYQADQEVLVRSRTRDSRPGSWVLTPLLLEDGLSVVVNRGWIDNSGGLVAVPDEFRAPEGEVTVEGLLRTPESRGSFGSRDPDEGVLTDLARADIARLDQQVPEDLLPLYIQLRTQVPTVGEADPIPVDPPEPGEGPHLSYAVQWAIFTTVALVGYPLILRKRAREIERGDEDPEVLAELDAS